MPSSSYLQSYGGRRPSSSSSVSSSSTSVSASAKKATAERNQQVLRTLLNDPGNKFCGDCKTSGHPRWASWSIGVFLCIRCSGIHRSMGTHISKVRSIDLDSWSDEQIENMVKWGNKRSNLYWEYKLPPNYVPDDSKIGNFIRTKYDLKRWVKPGGIPDPASLGEPEPAQNDTTPLSEVKSRLTNDSKPAVPSKSVKSSNNLIPDLLGGPVASTAAAKVGVVRTTVNSSANNTTASTTSGRPPAVPAKNDLLGGLEFGASASTSATVASASGGPPPPPKSDSLLGLDFSAPPTITQKPFQQSNSQKTQQSRPDLKKSILSLYAPAASRPVNSIAPINSPASAFDSLTSQTNSLSLGGMPSVPANNNINHLGSLNFGGGSSGFNSSHAASNSTASANNQSNLFDNLISGSSSSAWASTPSEHAVHTRKPSEDEWASFSSAPPTKSVHASSSNAGQEEDLFQNVWS